MSNKKRIDKTKVGYAMTAFVAACTIALFLYPHLKRHYEKQHLLQLQQVVRLIQNGTIKPNQFGDVTLPPHFAQLTKNGHVYLSRNIKQPFILFPEQVDKYDVEWQTRLPPSQRRPTEHRLNIEGYVYCQVPLPKGWSVGVDDLAVDGVFIEIPPRQLNWYYAQPMPLDW